MTQMYPKLADSGAQSGNVLRNTLDQQLAERDMKKQSRDLEKAQDKEWIEAQMHKRQTEDQEAQDRLRLKQAHYRDALNVQVYFVFS
jgi:hypothetical protein